MIAKCIGGAVAVAALAYVCGRRRGVAGPVRPYVPGMVVPHEPPTHVWPEKLEPWPVAPVIHDAKPEPAYWYLPGNPYPVLYGPIEMGDDDGE